MEYAKLPEEHTQNGAPAPTSALTRRRAAVVVGVAMLLGAAVLALLEVSSVAGDPSLAVVEAGCQVNLLLVRHCDKVPPWGKDPTPDNVCTELGEVRGMKMADIFGPGGRFPTPDYIFARKFPAGAFASRDMYLLWPLERRLGLMTNTSFPDTSQGVDGLAQSLLGSRGQMCQEAQARKGTNEATVLVAWNHCTLTALAQALGCDEGRCRSCWDDRDFDTVLWLRYELASAKHGGGLRWRFSFHEGREGVSKVAEDLSGFDYRECRNERGEGRIDGFPCELPHTDGARLG